MILELQLGPFEGMSGKGAMPPNTAVRAHGPLPVTPAKCFWWAHTHVHAGTKERGICWVFGCDLFKMCSLCPLIQLSKDLLQQLLFSLFPFHFSLSCSLSLNFSSSLPHWFSLVCQRCCLPQQQVFSFLQMTILVARWSCPLVLRGHFARTVALMAPVKDYHG